MDFVSSPYGVRRRPLNTFANTITAIAGVIGLTIAVSTANQTAWQIKDYTGNVSLYATGSGSIVGSGTLALKSLPGCSVVSTTSSGKLICGSGITGTVNTGAILTIGDQRYVKKSGDTMTGSLKILNGSSLQVAGTITGSIIKAVTSLSSSGTLVFEGAASGSSLFLGTSFTGVGLADCDNATTSKLLWNISDGRFLCGTDQNTTYTFGQGLTSNGTNVRISSTVTGSILSGTHLVASRSLTVSGTLLVKTSITSKGSVSGSTIDGFGLGSCSNASTSKLLYNNTTDQFTCGTDQTASLTAGQGLTLNGTSIRLNATVTGSTLSGTHIVASRSLTVSGATLIKGNLTSKGTISGAMLNIMAGGSPSYIMGALALGKTTVNTNVKLDVVGQISGSTLSISSASSFSGAVLMKRNLTVGRTISGSRLVVSGHTNISGSLLVKTSASAATIFGKRCPVPMSVELSASGSALTTGSGKLTMLVPRYLSGYSLAHFSATLDQSGTTGLTRIGVRNVDKGKRSLFSTLPSIDSTETKTATAATPYVINASNDDISGDDRLTFDILQIQTTAPKGMDITMEFSCP